MHAFLQNTNSFAYSAVQRFCMYQYPSFIYTKTQPYIFPILGFLQETGIEKPDYSGIMTLFFLLCWVYPRMMICPVLYVNIVYLLGRKRNAR